MVIAIVIVGISVLILIHELGHFLAAKAFGLYVEEFGFGFPPRLFSVKKGETTYSFNLLPFGGFVKIHGENKEAVAPGMERRSFTYPAFWKKAAIILAGVTMNFILGWFIISGVFMVGTPQALVLTDVSPGSPAAVAGIEPGDALINFTETDAFITYVQEHAGEEVELIINRSGEESVINVVPRVTPPDGEGTLGVTFVEAGIPQTGFFASLWQGLRASWGIVVTILVSLAQIIISLFTQGRLLDNFVGPVGIFNIANQAAGLGLPFLMQLIGLISLNLFILNVLPFPALDGGRMLFLVIEKIKGSPLSAKFEQSANAAGFLFLLLLMLAITIRDVIRLF